MVIVGGVNGVWLDGAAELSQPLARDPVDLAWSQVGGGLIYQVM